MDLNSSTKIKKNLVLLFFSIQTYLETLQYGIFQTKHLINYFFLIPD